MESSQQTSRFVILRHECNGVHWDLMIEREGVLLTWAVDSLLEVNREMPARRLADHRLLYLEYEGPISGNRGEVSRVDEGTCLVEAVDEGQLSGELRGGRWAGRLELRRQSTGPRGIEPEVWVLRLGKVD